MSRNIWGYNFRVVEYLFLALVLTSITASEAPAGARAVDNSTVVLTWTAPGDDGRVGQAERYDIRYAYSPPTDTGLWWTSAHRVSAVPDPSPAGKIDSCLIAGLDLGKECYFALKTVDDAGNWSALSKIATLPGLPCADINGDGGVNLLDVVFLMNHVYNIDPAPVPPADGDVDGTGTVNIMDAIYLRVYILDNGPRPLCD